MQPHASACFCRITQHVESKAQARLSNVGSLNSGLSGPFQYIMLGLLLVHSVFGAHQVDFPTDEDDNVHGFACTADEVSYQRLSTSKASWKRTQSQLCMVINSSTWTLESERWAKGCGSSYL